MDTHPRIYHHINTEMYINMIFILEAHHYINPYNYKSFHLHLHLSLIIIRYLDL